MGQISVAHNFGMLCIRNLGTDFNLQTFQNMFDLQTLKLVELCARLSEVAQSCPTLCDLMDCSLSGFSVHGIFQARVLEWIAISFSRDLPDPGIEPGFPALQADALPSEPPGKPASRKDG